MSVWNFLFGGIGASALFFGADYAIGFNERDLNDLIKVQSEEISTLSGYVDNYRGFFSECPTGALEPVPNFEMINQCVEAHVEAAGAESASKIQALEASLETKAAECQGTIDTLTKNHQICISDFAKAENAKDRRIADFVNAESILRSRYQELETVLAPLSDFESYEAADAELTRPRIRSILQRAQASLQGFAQAHQDYEQITSAFNGRIMDAAKMDDEDLAALFSELMAISADKEVRQDTIKKILSSY